MYRAEFFSYDVQYKDFALFDDDTELSLDYIAWDASQIKIPGKRLAVIKGDLVHITRDGKTAPLQLPALPYQAIAVCIF